MTEGDSSMRAQLAEYWKSILAFLALFLTNAATDWMANGQPWPASVGELFRWALSIAAGTWLVYRVPNRRRPDTEQ